VNWRIATIRIKGRPKTHDVDTYPSLCLYLAACFSCLLALLSSNVSPLAKSLAGSMKDVNKERWVLMTCLAVMPTPTTVVGKEHLIAARDH